MNGFFSLWVLNTTRLIGALFDLLKIGVGPMNLSIADALMCIFQWLGVVAIQGCEILSTLSEFGMATFNQSSYGQSHYRIKPKDVDV